MMRKVYIVGIGMHKCGKHLDKSLLELGRVAVWNAVEDANISLKDIECAYFSNSLAGLVTGQEGVRGQTVLRPLGIREIPLINVENACASGTTGLRGACLEVAAGNCDVALALGVEKLYLPKTSDSIRILSTDSDIRLRDMGFQFTGHYAMKLRARMEKYGWTKEHFAQVTVKNSYNGSLNPYAQHNKPLSLDDVLNSRLVAEPMHLFMCSSISDGAAAAIVCSEEKARQFTSKPLVHVAASILKTGCFIDSSANQAENIVTLTAREAYEKAGLGPEDVDIAEVHDAVAPAEIYHYEELGFCGEGEGVKLVEEGRTKITGDIPVNTSGGLTFRGHPIGATGLAQVAEVVWQLRGEAGERQVKDPKVGLIQNSGGFVEGDAAATTVTILTR